MDLSARQQVGDESLGLLGDYALRGHLQASGRTAEDFEALWSLALPAEGDEEEPRALRAEA